MVSTAKEISVKFLVRTPESEPASFIGHFYPYGAILEDVDTGSEWFGMNTTFQGG
jgi:hypothetical protein